MEHNEIKERRKKKIKDWIFMVVVIIVLSWIAFTLWDIRQKVIDHYEAFDENPLLFGAKKYDIRDARATTNDGRVFYFNQQKMWVENQATSLTFDIEWDKPT